jgi:hypothetical protein
MVYGAIGLEATPIIILGPVTHLEADRVVGRGERLGGQGKGRYMCETTNH